MKIRKGKPHYKLPPFGEILSVYHRDKEGRTRTLMPASRLTGGKELGTPTAFMVIEGRLYLFPVPDKSDTLIVRYYPPAQEV